MLAEEELLDFLTTSTTEQLLRRLAPVSIILQRSRWSVGYVVFAGGRTEEAEATGEPPEELLEAFEDVDELRSTLGRRRRDSINNFSKSFQLMFKYV